GSGKIEAAFLVRGKSRLAIARFDTLAAKDSVPFMTRGITFQRDCQWTTTTVARVAAARGKFLAHLEATIAAAQAALAAKDYDKARDLAKEALSLSPNDPHAAKVARQALSGAHWLRNLLIGLAALAAAAAVGWQSYRRYGKQQRVKRAEKFLESGNFPGAINQYKSLLAVDPQNKDLLLSLAMAYIESGKVTADAAPTLQAARKAHPTHPEITVALASAYSQAESETEEALETYLVALGTMESGRGKIAYHAANVLRQRGDTEQATRYYKMAMREGYNELPVYSKLTDIYLETNQFTDKTLQVLETVYNERSSDQKYMDGLCRSYAAARRVDEIAEAAYLQLLTLNPESEVALRQMAKCELKNGHPAKAAEYAERARKVSPKDNETISILSSCYMFLQRDDDKATTIYKQALESTPTQADLLRAAGLGLLKLATVSDEDYQLIKRATAANPRDLELLAGLAEAAKQRSETKTLIQCLENLNALGAGTPEVITQLATAYAAVGHNAPESEAVYREALKLDPDNLQYIQNLCRVLVRLDRKESYTLLLLEKLFARDNTDVEIGKHLIKTLLHNERFDDAIKLARYLIQNNKDDADLQKLFAQASLSNNRLDEAIKQFEHLYKLHPEDREAIVNLATAYAAKQVTDSAAVVHYQKALEVAPENASIRAIYARSHCEAGRFAQGIEEYRRTLVSDKGMEKRISDDVRALIANNQDRTDLRWFLADVLIDRNYLKEAMDQLEAIFEIDPTQLKTVLQALDRVLAKDSSNAEANLQKGVLLKAQGRFEESRLFLERAYNSNVANAEAARELEDLYELLIKENDDVETRFQLGKLNHALKEYDKAIGHFQKTAQDFRYENESIKMLGMCFVGKGMLEFALQEFKKLVIDDEMKEILYDLGQRYQAKNDVVGAKQVYRILFAADINYKDVKQRFEAVAGHTSDPISLEGSALLTQLGEKAQRRYELLEELGRGAMGIVYKAKDNELEEVVALKILPDNLSQHPEAISRFRAEARSARRLAHPNIVRIHDIGEELGRKYISMEFVDGSDLKKFFRANNMKLDWKVVVELMTQICNAMDYAHSMGIVHRDIKPANIMLTEDLVVKVSDFGIAKMLEKTGETIAGAIMGTPLYMSPEQVMGSEIDNRADIYSLGIMMYELLSGKAPFTTGDLAYQHLKVPPPPLKDIPETLAAIVMKCLEKDKENRYMRAGDIVKAFEAAKLG
ncbi:MAG: protein kinase, partial [Candidatus Sumerlaeaceae bacterium]|nr:protein kinase [Candidatus Sumerlaeaceae bacterium]